jgi:hypothetical protein
MSGTSAAGARRPAEYLGYDWAHGHAFADIDGMAAMGGGNLVAGFQGSRGRNAHSLLAVASMDRATRAPFLMKRPQPLLEVPHQQHPTINLQMLFDGRSVLHGLSPVARRN